MIDMEGPIWEVDVQTLEATRLFVKPVPGWHAKGGYTGQGRLIVANNGELRTADLDSLTWEAPERSWSKGPEDAGVLAEFDGTSWTIVARRPHTEVTGPGGIYGAPTPDAPVWSIGWDKRSVLLQVRSNGAWRTYRLPKASYTYDPSHGWFTEWPRIRAIGDGPLLLNMHGTFFDFPLNFDQPLAGSVRSRLICITRPTLPSGTGVSCWPATTPRFSRIFSPPSRSRTCASCSARRWRPTSGRRSDGAACGVNDEVSAGRPSEPLLVAGYRERCVHLANRSSAEVSFSIEVDRVGRWELAGGENRPRSGEWLRPGHSRRQRECRLAASHRRSRLRRDGVLHLSSPRPPSDAQRAIFSSLAPVMPTRPGPAGCCARPARRARCSFSRGGSTPTDAAPMQAYYEVDERLEFARVDAPEHGRRSRARRRAGKRLHR